MREFFTSIIDFIFPPTKSALELRAISPLNIFSIFPIAPIPPYPFIISLFAYKHPLVSEFIWNIKYKKDRHALECGGYALYVKLLEMPEMRAEKTEKTILVPIPISKKRRKERGYNQCELLIESLLKFDKENILGKNYEILTRKKDLLKQTMKDRTERLKMNNVFEVKKDNDLLDKNIIIIDDVATTGSTLREAREILLRVGYKNIRALTLAH